MKIKYMLNDIKDMELLYRELSVAEDSPFGGPEDVIEKVLLADEYAETILRDVQTRMSSISDCQYLKGIERIGREGYQVAISMERSTRSYLRSIASRGRRCSSMSSWILWQAIRPTLKANTINDWKV